MLDPNPMLVGRSKQEPAYWERLLTTPRLLLGAVAAGGLLGIALWALLPASQEETLSTEEPLESLSAERAYSDASGTTRSRKQRRRLRGLSSVVPMDSAPDREEPGPPEVLVAGPAWPARSQAPIAAGAPPSGPTGEVVAAPRPPSLPFARKSFEPGSSLGGGRGSGASSGESRASRTLLGQSGAASAGGSAAPASRRSGAAALAGGATLAGGGGPAASRGAPALAAGPAIAPAPAGGPGAPAAIATAGGPDARAASAAGGSP
ncbi:MAG: hypothetical protein HY554_03365, partial [Elusimicrobia bacterium]|nr:hypothetical protein [Elusimicrobiota bacterium]